MLWTLLRKEALAHLLSARFQLTVALIVILMAVGGALFRGEYHRRLDDFNAAEASRLDELAQRAEREAPLFQVFSYFDQGVMARPAELGFIADGQERELPNMIEVNAFRVRTPTSQQRGNAMIPYFSGIDWVMVVGVVLSFAAIVLTFDGFAGEKERGTLRLLLSSAVPRWMLVASKMLGATAVLLVAFLIGTLIQLIILMPAGWLVVDAALLGRMLLAFALVAVFVMIFVLLGLLISACQRSAASALMISLLLWALLIVVIPRSIVLCSAWLPRVESAEEVDEQATAALMKGREEYLHLHPKKENAWISGHWSPQESLDLACQLWATYDAHTERWWRRQIRQVKLTRRMGWISPSIVVGEALESVAGSGLAGYERFLDAVLQYRGDLQQQVRGLYPLDTVNAPGLDQDLMARLDEVKVDISKLPQLDRDRVGLGQTMAEVAVPGTVLLALVLLLFLAASVAAARYDVR